MGVKSYVTNKLDNILAGTSMVAGGLTLGQFPQYLAQYMQRLGGHIDEATHNAQDYSIPQLTERANKLKEGLEAITNAEFPWRLWEFAKHFDLSIARRALENYTPGMTFNAEGLGYCAMGALMGYVGYEVGKIPIKKVLLGKKSQPQGHQGHGPRVR